MLNSEISWSPWFMPHLHQRLMGGWEKCVGVCQRHRCGDGWGDLMLQDDTKSSSYLSGQIIATSHDLTPDSGLVREITSEEQGNLGWGNTIIWPLTRFIYHYVVVWNIFYICPFLGKWSNLTIWFFSNGLVQPPTRPLSAIPHTQCMVYTPAFG